MGDKTKTKEPPKKPDMKPLKLIKESLDPSKIIKNNNR